MAEFADNTIHAPSLQIEVTNWRWSDTIGGSRRGTAKCRPWGEDMGIASELPLLVFMPEPTVLPATAISTSEEDTRTRHVCNCKSGADGWWMVVLLLGGCGTSFERNHSSSISPAYHMPTNYRPVSRPCIPQLWSSYISEDLRPAGHSTIYIWLRSVAAVDQIDCCAQQ